MEAAMLAGKRILLIVGGGIAAFKTPELVRLFKAAGAAVTPVLTRLLPKKKHNFRKLRNLSRKKMTLQHH